MSLDLIRGLYDYHWWANRRLFDVAAALGDDAVRRDIGAQFSMPTIKGLFAHLYGADFVWLARWKGTSPTRLPEDADFDSLTTLRARWDELEREQREFIRGLADGDLARRIAYMDTRGKPFTLPLGPLLQHVANHATHHRSEIATMLTMISGSPPDTGINTFLLLTTGQA